jgi:hypothetical protein
MTPHETPHETIRDRIPNHTIAASTKPTKSSTTPLNITQEIPNKMNPILHSLSNRTMEKQMVDSFPSLLAHATLGFDKNLKYLPLPKVINSQNFPQSCSPKEKVHLSLDFRLPQTIPQEVKLG